MAYVECDGLHCHETIEGDDFMTLWNDAKADGWKCRNISGVWLHYCPECANEYFKPNLKKLMGEGK
jgi:hypothetical protein